MGVCCGVQPAYVVDYIYCGVQRLLPMQGTQHLRHQKTAGKHVCGCVHVRDYFLMFYFFVPVIIIFIILLVF